MTSGPNSVRSARESLSPAAGKFNGTSPGPQQDRQQLNNNLTLSRPSLNSSPSPQSASLSFTYTFTSLQIIFVPVTWPSRRRAFSLIPGRFGVHVPFNTAYICTSNLPTVSKLGYIFSDSHKLTQGSELIIFPFVNLCSHIPHYGRHFVLILGIGAFLLFT